MSDASAFNPADDAAYYRLRATLAGLGDRPPRPMTSHHIVLRGMRFHYLAWGAPDAPPLLFLHGGGQTCHTWELVCDALADRYRCLALDQRGHGDSEWSYEGDYSPSAQAGDIAAFIDALGLAQPVIVGMSMGCLNGLYTTLARPDAVSALVAIDAGPWINIAGAGPIRDFMHTVSTLDQLDDFVATALRFNPQRDARLLRRSLLHNLRRRADGRLMWKTDLRQPTDLKVAEGWITSLRERVGALRCPVLVVRGGNSAVMSDDDAARFAAAVPDGRWVRIEGAGHAVQGDQPKALIAVLEDFLGTVPRCKSQ
ncbi:alpha/beta fold hydrolase [Reyranella sp. CPCC 100927]|uniref:alpha/beta fold hydrolase n=1 Tax=Reyranella sp. CPCC 100927 TaxID=2599616 RepID=UPI0011B84FBA|nr:alpha/beta hydrolase [Reyranella sp. CPCC 100927]TWS96626.1 alpha/beta hydrolase [Reyranella sp. CPCC 100927]